MQLHDTTLMLTLALAALAGAVVIGSAATMREDAPGARFWAAGLLAFAVAYGSQLLPLTVGTPLRASLFNLSLIAGHVLWLTGTRAFAGRAWPAAALVLAYLALASLTLALTYLWPWRELRLGLLGVALAGIRLSTGWALWWHIDRDPNERRVARAAALVAALESAFMLLHAWNGVRGQVNYIGEDLGGPAIFTWLSALLSILISAPLLMLLGTSRLIGELDRAAHHDPLTGLLNRRGFFLAMRPLLCHEGRQQQEVSVLMLDVDHFKQLNDNYGHALGDRVLGELGHTLRESLRGSDVAVRWGGEEFCVLLSGTGAAAAQTLADRIRRRFSDRCADIGELDGRPVTVSVGIACAQVDRLPFEQLQNRADAALYQAKHGGRDRVAVSA